MGDLISRDRLLRDTYFQEDRYPESHLLRMAIGEQPAVDAVPVVHARWEWLGPNRLVPECMCGTCSNCKVRTKYIVNRAICPNCGAKMDGEMNAE